MQLNLCLCTPIKTQLDKSFQTSSNDPEFKLNLNQNAIIMINPLITELGGTQDITKGAEIQYKNARIKKYIIQSWGNVFHEQSPNA